MPARRAMSARLRLWSPPRPASLASAFASPRSIASSIPTFSASCGSSPPALAYADLRAQFYHRLQSLYGEPGSVSALETIFNDFTRALQGLANNPELASARTAVISAADLLTGRLNAMTGQVQDLRAEAELGIADSIDRANDAMQQIVRLNKQLGAATNPDAATATLLDQRDAYVDQLAELMDIRVIDNGQNQITIFTNTGVELVGTQAAQLAFDPQGTMTAETLWSADPTQRAVGTITLLPADRR